MNHVSHDSHEWMLNVTRMKEPCLTHTNEPCHTYAGVMSCIWVHLFTNMHALCCTCECVMPHKCMSHVTYMNASCQVYEYITLLTRMKQDKHALQHTATHCNNAATPCNTLQRNKTNIPSPIHASEHTREWVMSHVWMSRITHTRQTTNMPSCINESSCTNKYIITHIWVSHAHERHSKYPYSQPQDQ